MLAQMLYSFFLVLDGGAQSGDGCLMSRCVIARLEERGFELLDVGVELL